MALLLGAAAVLTLGWLCPAVRLKRAAVFTLEGTFFIVLPAAFCRGQKPFSAYVPARLKQQAFCAFSAQMVVGSLGGYAPARRARNKARFN